MTISEKIFYLLEKKGLSQKNFADMTGITASTISDWKRKKTNPSADKIMTICRALEITPYELLEEETEQRDKQDYILLNKNTDVFMLLEQYNQLNKGQQQRVMGYVNAMIENNVEG